MTTEAPKKNTVTIDGVVVEFKPGETIMKAAERAALDGKIPRFCYHPGLPVAGTCRMCTVEVEKAPKLMTACSTPCADGWVIHSKSEKVQKSRAGVMEFLLANHPLDCPVCDQAGECSLQDYNYEYGPGTSEFKDSKRVFAESTTKKLSDKLTLNMNRCIHCERCVRYTEDVTKTYDVLMQNRGWKKELVTAEESAMKNEYQGNIADICPVGAITFNDFRFKKRVWFLKSHPSICDGCSKGCSVWVDEEKDTIERYRARRNDAVNGHWMCDLGRVSFRTFRDPARIVEPMLAASGHGLQATNWETVVPWFIQEGAKATKVLFLIGTDATTEEAKLILEKSKNFARGRVDVFYHTGIEGVKTSADDKALDQLLIRKDKTSNTKGLESLGLKAWDGNSSYDLAVFFRFGRSGIPAKIAVKEIACGVFSTKEASQFAAVFPGLGVVEKSGSYTNCDGVVQSFKAAVKSRGHAASIEKIFEGIELMLHKGGPRGAA